MKKKLILIISIIIFLAFVLILLFPKSPRVSILTTNIDESSIYTYIEKSYKKQKLKSINNNLEEKRKEPDIIIEPLSYSLNTNNSLNTELYNTIPRSIANTGVVNNKTVALPIFLDHIEVAFRADIYAKNGLLIEDRILSLKDMENVLLKQVSPTYFPLVMAGNTNEELLDVISVLTLSLGGAERYNNLLNLLISKNQPESYITYDLGNGWTLKVVIDKLKEWKEKGILHPQWYDFDTKKVQLYSERQITSTVIMRLSTHRSWPFHILRRWQSSPFPFNNPKDAGSAIIAPPYITYIPTKSRVVEKTELVLQDLISKDFQENIVKQLQLAPVHSTAETLDRESDDLRFWAAASREVLPSLTEAAPKKTLLEFFNELRSEITK